MKEMACVSSTTNILELPLELIQNYIFPYLEGIDIYNFGESGNRRMKAIFDDYFKLGKY